MGRLTKPLSNTEIQKKRAIDKEITLHDGDGLFLLIKPSGKKLWRFRYQRPDTKARTNISLGAYPYLGLADARKIRDEYLSLLVKGIDPQTKAAEQEEQAEIAEESRFINVAKKWFEFKKKSITEDYAKDIWRSLEKDVFPCI
ncbi:integrase arm-type DNA-binding domain-containing protein [Utexia brackfieldae]